MKQATVVFLIREDEICLGLKKRGFGKDKYNGFGGKVGDKPEFINETIEESAKREGMEEFAIVANNLENVAVMQYIFPEKPEWGQEVHVFICRDWKGEPQESEEMKPVWFKLDHIPYEKMWDDDIYWIPRVLAGEKVEARFEFDNDGKVLKREIKGTGRSSERKVV